MVLPSLCRLWRAGSVRGVGLAATPLSELALPGDRLGARARASLGLVLIAAGASACLITDPPQFTPPKHTAPFLVDSSADPDPRKVKIVDSVDLQTNQTVTFSADVVSQDDTDQASDFRQVFSKLYIDYGFKDAPGQPFRFGLPGTSLGPGSLDQTSGRRVSANWIPDVYRVDPGCHTATLVVSHIFDDEPGCWVCADDFSSITWQILRCDSTIKGDCDKLDLSGCEGLTSSCAAFHSGSDAGQQCPEAADGGTP